MKKIIALAFAVSLAGCALPTTQVKTGAQRPTLVIQGAPIGVVLYVDGLTVGAANQYDGLSQKLFIEEGVHQLELRQGAQVLMSQKIFSSNGETSTLEYKAVVTQ
jgi:hypothetical protein